MKSYLLIQLVSNGRAIWQVKQDVPIEHCRRMTPDQLKAVGDSLANELGVIIEDTHAPHSIIEGPRARRVKSR